MTIELEKCVRYLYLNFRCSHPSVHSNISIRPNEGKDDGNRGKLLSILCDHSFNITYNMA